MHYCLLLILALFVSAFIYPSLAQKVTARIVEDGGTGQYSAIMQTDPSLSTHTIFRPQDLSVFGKKINYPLSPGETVPAQIRPGSMSIF